MSFFTLTGSILLSDIMPLALTLPPDDKLLAYVAIASVAAVKFLVAILIAIAKPEFAFWEIMLSAGGGALVGNVVYTYFGTGIRNLLGRYLPKKKSMPFARRRKIFVLWKRYGLLGIAFMAPLISPMASIGIALSFQENPGRILKYMTISILGWTVVLSAFKQIVLNLIA
ncbi:MAG: hypothetical protein SF053_03980 [Bacteroidia bacterium]|nr:hypothetical protein [Bacteroidia bacterium]